MTFFALLVKEMRLLTRRERTIWLMVTYVLLLGLIGWFELHALNTDNWSTIGNALYITLMVIQLILILFITPAFTATSINGEKERQTYDMLLCSRLSPAALVGGKLLSGLTNTLILIAASLPVFSLVFFFGGISPLQAFEVLIIFIVTALLLAAFGLFCSSLVARPAVSTLIAYLITLLWCGLPPLSYLIYVAAGANGRPLPASTQLPFYLHWNPIIALLTTFNFGGIWTASYQILNVKLFSWQIYLIVSLLATAVLFVASMQQIRPRRWRDSGERHQHKKQARQQLETKIPVEA
jgi:ABC-type Na+ efflux pump, permease component